MQDQLRLSKYRFGLIISIIVCVLPELLWLESHHLNEYLDMPGGMYVLLGKTAALVGTAMFAWSLILSARPRFIESLFGGLDKMYAIHRYFGVISLGLLMLHPLFLIFRFNARKPGSALGMLVSANLAYNLGIFALVTMLAVIIGTVFMKLKHESFIRWHRLLGGIFLIGAAHGLMVNAEIMHNPPLRSYMIGLLALAALCYLYYTVFGQLLVERYHYRIRSSQQITAGVTEVCLQRDSSLAMVFIPGQFVFLSFKDAPVSAEAHPFSIASSNRDGELRFVVKALGDYTANLALLKPGLEALVEGPYGRFSYLNVSNKRQVWIAGGIGITPFLSMARSLPKGRYTIDLIYSARSEVEAVFVPEFKALEALHKRGLMFHMWLESKSGFIKAENIDQICMNTEGADYLICGPPMMMKSIATQLQALGIAESNIYYEEFSM